MKHIFFNAKRFDISPERGGVNRIAPMQEWAAHIISLTQEKLGEYPREDAEFVMFLPEAHILPARAALTDGSVIKLGSQSVHRMDTSPGGNFGAFTTNRTANAISEMGCEYTISAIARSETTRRASSPKQVFQTQRQSIASSTPKSKQPRRQDSQCSTASERKARNSMSGKRF